MNKQDLINCPNCDLPFDKRDVHRYGKRFCSSSCRQRFSRAKNKKPKHIQGVNNVLLQNWKILNGLIEKEEFTLPYAYLKNLGFNAYICTGIAQSKTGNLICLLYNLAYYRDSEGIIIINHFEESGEKWAKVPIIT